MWGRVRQGRSEVKKTIAGAQGVPRHEGRPITVRSTALRTCRAAGPLALTLTACAATQVAKPPPPPSADQEIARAVATANARTSSAAKWRDAGRVAIGARAIEVYQLGDGGPRLLLDRDPGHPSFSLDTWLAHDLDGAIAAPLPPDRALALAGARARASSGPRWAAIRVDAARLAGVPDALDLAALHGARAPLSVHRAGVPRPAGLRASLERNLIPASTSTPSFDRSRAVITAIGDLDRGRVLEAVRRAYGTLRGAPAKPAATACAAATIHEGAEGDAESLAVGWCVAARPGGLPHAGFEALGLALSERLAPAAASVEVHVARAPGASLLELLLVLPPGQTATAALARVDATLAAPGWSARAARAVAEQLRRGLDDPEARAELLARAELDGGVAGLAEDLAFDPKRIAEVAQVVLRAPRVVVLSRPRDASAPATPGPRRRRRSR